MNSFIIHSLSVQWNTIEMSSARNILGIDFTMDVNINARQCNWFTRQYFPTTCFHVLRWPMLYQFSAPDKSDSSKGSYHYRRVALSGGLTYFTVVGILVMDDSHCDKYLSSIFIANTILLHRYAHVFVVSFLDVWFFVRIEIMWYIHLYPSSYPYIWTNTWSSLGL